MIYAQLATVALIVVYIVGVSGFTHSWRNALARILGIREEHMRPLKPFDCPACMTWWTCIVYAIAVHQFSLWTVAASAVLSLLSIPIQDFLLLIREGLTALLRKLWTKI